MEAVQVAKRGTISFFEFKEKFNNEEICREHLYKLRWPDGFKCPKYVNEGYYHIKGRSKYQCTTCYYQASRNIYFPALSRLTTLFLRAADDGRKRGRGTSKAKAVVNLYFNEKEHPQYAKMEIVKDHTFDIIATFADTKITPGSNIPSYAFRPYNQIKNDGYEHQPKVFNSKDDENHLKRLHTIVSDAKTFINGTYYGLDNKHTQLYLSKFYYRFIRRYKPTELFNRLLFNCVIKKKLSYAELTT
jgi:hypothetical protein